MSKKLLWGVLAMVLSLSLNACGVLNDITTNNIATVESVSYQAHLAYDTGLRVDVKPSNSAEATISRKMGELKSVTTTIKADIAAQEGILHSNAEKLRSGYEMRSKEVNLDYKTKGIIRYLDKETGEILSERPMTEEEQLRMTSKAVDAEQIIREASEQGE